MTMSTALAMPEQGDPGRERRRYPRYSLRFGDTHRARYKPLFRKARVPLRSTRVHNISEGGLCFSAKRGAGLRMGEMIGIEFRIPECSRIASMARVVRLLRRGSQVQVGVSFCDLPRYYRELIREQVSCKILEAEEEREASLARRLERELRPRLARLAPTIANITSVLLLLASFLTLYLYIAEKSRSPGWIHEAYQYISRIKQ